jgi:hypothetical protein
MRKRQKKTVNLYSFYDHNFSGATSSLAIAKMIADKIEKEFEIK